MKTASFFTFILVSLISVSCREAEIEIPFFDSSSNPITETRGSSAPENFSPDYETLPLSIVPASKLDSIRIRDKVFTASDSTKFSNQLECCGDHGQIPIKN
jgi:hypothetical protein